jgi:hypothetical protein
MNKKALWIKWIMCIFFPLAKCALFFLWLKYIYQWRNLPHIMWQVWPVANPTCGNYDLWQKQHLWRICPLAKTPDTHAQDNAKHTAWGLSRYFSKQNSIKNDNIWALNVVMFQQNSVSSRNSWDMTDKACLVVANFSRMWERECY